LKARKQVPRESYADVVKRMIDKETGKKKKKPKSIQDFEILAREGGMRF